MVLTTEWQNVASYEFVPGTGFKATFYLDAKYSTQSKANNTSTVQTRLRSVVNQGSGGGNGYKFTLSYAGNVEGSSYWGFANEIISTGEGTLVHNTDGTLSINLSASMLVNYTGLNASMSASVSLPSIARYPLITSAPNFNDEENPTISYTTTLGFEGAVVEAGIKTDLTQGPIILYRQVTVEDGNYTFNLTSAERDVLRSATPNSNSLTIYFVLKTTTTDNQEFFSTLQKTVSIVNANPTIENVTFTETNSKLVSILGSSANILVKNASVLSLSVPFTTYKYASPSILNVKEGTESDVIQSYSHPNPTSPDTFTNIQVTGTTNSGKFVFKITDSRGNVGTKTETSRTVLDYKQVSIVDFSMVRENPTSSNIILNLEANYYQQTFGSTPNVPIVKWKLDDGSYTTIPSSNYIIDTTNNKLTIIDYEMTNALVYTSNGTFTLTIEDLLTSVSDTQDVLKGVPTFDEGEHDLQVNGDLFIADTDGENAVNVLDRLDSPIGEILWTNSNPSVAFGQTTMYLSSSDYDMLEVFYIDYMRNGRVASARVPKGKPINILTLFDANQGQMYMGVRTIYYNNATELWANDCYSVITGSQLSVRTSDEWCIPLYVVGYKTGIF